MDQTHARGSRKNSSLAYEPLAVSSIKTSQIDRFCLGVDLYIPCSKYTHIIFGHTHMLFEHTCMISNPRNLVLNLEKSPIQTVPVEAELVSERSHRDRFSVQDRYNDKA